ncbi:hypothetical protein NDU88_008853 [Pleurodeles waltl]|uniref:Uncharacterized protein n=1 Tax=Pleurodeles waltl TaxID=8319 RepID=A0AAV7QRX1_PLEWA|nr:hypothetical protein NDU88_008853 [Pleurodeles waltl]
MPPTELLYLYSKLIDLEDRSCRDNINFFGFPEQLKGLDVQDFLLTTLATITGLTFDPRLEFQRPHHLGPRRQDGTTRPRSIIAWLLRHGQASQLLLAARSYGPFRTEGYEDRIAADFSKETSDCCKAFLALRHQLRQMEVKYGLFEPAQMWITKNVKSKDFYHPEDLRLFLNSLAIQTMDTTPPDWPSGQPTSPPDATPLSTSPGRQTLLNGDSHQRGRDLERPHGDRDLVLQTMAQHTQQQDRDTSCSPLKPPHASN